MSSKPASTGLMRVMRAFRYSKAGLFAAWRDEAAFRQEVVGLTALGALTAALPVPAVAKAVLFAQMAGVLVAELLNSSLEAIVDKASPEQSELAGKAKDCASAAVLVACLALAGSWLYLAGPAVVTAARVLL